MAAHSQVLFELGDGNRRRAYRLMDADETRAVKKMLARSPYPKLAPRAAIRGMAESPDHAVMIGSMPDGPFKPVSAIFTHVTQGPPEVWDQHFPDVQPVPSRWRRFQRWAQQRAGVQVATILWCFWVAAAPGGFGWQTIKAAAAYQDWLNAKANRKTDLLIADSRAE